MLLCCLLLALLGWIISDSKSFQDCIDATKYPYSDQSVKECLPVLPVTFNAYKVCAGHFISENQEAIIALGTIVIALFTIILGIATVSLVNGADKTAERQLRAYVGVDAVSVSGISPNAEPCAMITIRNFGQTPAYDLTHVGDIRLAPFPDAGTLEPITSAIPPKQPLHPNAIIIKSVELRHSLTNEQLASVRHRNAAIYIFGIIKYRDTFGHERTTKYRAMTGGNMGIRGNSVAGCEEGNNAD